MKTIVPAEQELIDRRRPDLQNPRIPELAELQWIARWMDSLVEIPGLRTRVGLDSILGLVPGLGDFGATLISLYILQAASRQGVSRLTMTRMGFNILLDLGLGSIPVVGDVFDVYWKANLRNVALLENHLQTNPKAAQRLRRGDWLFLCGMIVVLLLFLVGSVTVTYLTVTWLGKQLLS